jgi:DNA-binding transcriptional LysR family regulator
MARAGAGVAILPDFSVRADVAAGRLRRLLPGHRLPGGAVHLLYPGARPPPKVRALVSFARTQDLGG